MINSELKQKMLLANVPKIKAIIMDCFEAFLTPKSLPKAISSDTTLVQAIFIPEDASVIPNIYVVIISPNTPKDSLSILFDIYILKISLIICKKNELPIISRELNKKTLNRFKISPIIFLC